MIGTVINMGTIVAGTVVGAFAGARLSVKMRRTVLYGIGLTLVLLGIQMSLRTEAIVVVLGAMVLGGMIGEFLKIEERVDRFGEFLQARMSKGAGSSFGEAFVTSSLLFCIGPMAILGPIEDGLSGNYRLLTIKAALDGFAAVALSASMGWGVLLSSLAILVYQGGITLFASVLSRALTDPMVREMSATGGVLIVGIGLRLLEIKGKELPLANFIPAIAAAPALMALMPLLKGLF